jgi:hypothetical protein
MFVRDETMLAITVPAARSGLAQLARAGLLRASQDACDHGNARLERPGRPGGLTLTRVRARPLARAGDRAGLAIRWEAAPPGRELFSVLDADLDLVAAGKDATRLTLSGTYRALPGDIPDREVLHQVAATIIGTFLSRVAAGIASQHGSARTPPADDLDRDGGPVARTPASRAGPGLLMLRPGARPTGP